MQRQIIESVRDNKRTACAACHSPGKTFTLACTALWFLYAHVGAIVVTTAPTWRQVEDVIWREIRNLHARARVGLGGTMLKAPPRLELAEKWYGIGLSPKDAEAFAGWHAPYVLIICDEASGIPRKIYEAIRGLMSSGYIVRLLILGNPTRPEGELYDAFHRTRHMYAPGALLRISAWDTPNLQQLRHLRDAPKEVRLRELRAAPLVRPELTSPSYVADMEDEFGLDSAVYKVRVLAEFPPDAPDQLIPLHQLEDGARAWQDLEDEARWWELLHRWAEPVETGYDVARFGDSENVCASRSGDVWAELECWSGTDSVANVARCKDHALRHRHALVRVDECGLGGGPADYLIADPEVQAIGVNVARTARDAKKFTNLRAEAYWSLRDRARTGRMIIPADDRLIGQLSTLRYGYRPDGRLIIESKEEAMKRGVKSPDRAEAVMLSQCASVGAAPIIKTVGKTTDWRRMHG